MARSRTLRAAFICVLLPAVSSGAVGVAVAPSSADVMAAHVMTAGAPAPPPVSGARVDPALDTGSQGDVSVVVRLRPAVADLPVRQVRQLGGRITAELPLINGFAATLPRGAVQKLAADPGVEVISANRAVRPQGRAVKGGGELAPRVVEAPKAWSTGLSGRGVTVALLDTGVADLPDLAGRLVPVKDDDGRTASCYDLSGEGHCGDSYGHGTFIAGLIAGNGSASRGTPIGAAPEANVLSVKVAGASGAADVSTVLAGIQWVVSFRDTYDVRVLNLSLGTDSTQSWKDDPLNYAVEKAWEAGILVVVAAANNGPAPGTIAKPGDDPWVLTVGAVDSNGTSRLGDDRVPDFSSRGPTRDGIAKPDLVAPGAHVLSLRSPGSTIETKYPTSGTGPYRTGSGTSMAAGVASGAAALVLQAHPDLTPDRLKHALRSAAQPVASSDPSLVGAGLIDAFGTATKPAPGSANAGLQRSSGLGDLGLSRGSLQMRTADPLQTVMSGRQTAQLLLWDPASLTGVWTAPTWYTSVNSTAGWNTAYWYGGEFNGHNWTGHNWTGASFYNERDDSAGYGRHGAGSASYGAWD